MEIVSLQDGNSGIAAYCLPTSAGSIHTYFELAKAVGAGHLIHGIQIAERESSGNFKKFSSLREMATAIVPQFLAHHRDGPVCLIGYSFAASLAIELAQQLAGLGKQVQLVVIIDAPPPAACFTPLYRIAQFIRNLGPWALRAATRTVTNANYRSVYSSKMVQTLPAWYEQLPEDIRMYVKSNLANFQKHCFEGGYRGKVLLFRSSEREAHPLRFCRQLEDFGWGSITGASVEVVYFPGDHISVMQQPKVTHIANRLRLVLSECARSAGQDCGHLVKSRW